MVCSHWVFLFAKVRLNLGAVFNACYCCLPSFIWIFSPMLYPRSSLSFYPRMIGLTQVVCQQWHQLPLQPRPPFVQTPRTSCSAQGTRAEKGQFAFQSTSDNKFEMLQSCVISTILNVFEILCHVNLIACENRA